MDIASLMRTAVRLSGRLDNPGGFPSGGRPGSADGPSGQPSPELVREFETVLNGDEPDPQPSGTASVQAAAPDAAGNIPIRDADPAGAFAPAPVRPAEAVPRTGDELEAGRLLERICAGNPEPLELFRLQYLTGMLRVHGAAAQQASQKTNEGFESLLKQRG